LESDPQQYLILTRDIRKTILQYISIDEENVEYFLERSRDSDISVRTQFYKRLALVPEIWEMIDQDQMFLIIKNGMIEREDKVKTAFFEMLFQSVVTDFEKLFGV
jgi:hypothetical protein